MAEDSASKPGREEIYKVFREGPLQGKIPVKGELVLRKSAYESMLVLRAVPAVRTLIYFSLLTSSAASSADFSLHTFFE